MREARRESLPVRVLDGDVFDTMEGVRRDYQLIVLAKVVPDFRTTGELKPLKRRIDEASRFVPLDQLCLSPQCGFSSTVEGNSITFEEEVAKLRLVVETAQDVWG